MNKKEAIIVDIDGTLANCDHRRHFVDGTHGKQDWKAFYKSMIKDTVNKWCKEIILRFCHVEGLGWDTPVLLVSGRPEEYRELTNKWLHKNIFDCYKPNCLEYDEFNPKLFMRKTGDFRCDTIIKEEIYREHIEPFYDILFVIDDRAKVVKKWRELGLVTLHCADGEF